MRCAHGRTFRILYPFGSVFARRRPVAATGIRASIADGGATHSDFVSIPTDEVVRQMEIKGFVAQIFGTTVAAARLRATIMIKLIY